MAVKTEVPLWQALAVYSVPAILAAWLSDSHRVPWYGAASIGIAIGVAMVGIAVRFER